MKAIRRFIVRTALPEPLAPLAELMLNLRWSWHAGTRQLLASIDQDRWERSGHDPVAMLGDVPPARLDELAADGPFLHALGAASADLHDYLAGPRWYQSGDPGLTGAPAAIAYFSPEYGITAALPQYSGGLGILAGDHLKAASDLGVPLIGVGLLYRHGYFTQSLSAEGWQMERYPPIDPNGLPLTLLRQEDGTPVRVAVALADGRRLAAQVWQVRVGRVPLLLLDSYVQDNEPELREVTDRLYGGGSEHRLRQELLLGIGGVRALRAFCALTGHPGPEVFHTNEGHAGFLGLERIREYSRLGLSFDEAIEACRAGTVFTTHTPVPAGIDRFERHLVQRHFTGDAEDPALPADRVLALGAETYPGGDPGVFNMAVMGMRLAQRVNGVSRLHGAVSRQMFAGLWPGFDVADVPIGSVTNGVHAATWVAAEIIALAGPDPDPRGMAADPEGAVRLAREVSQAAAQPEPEVPEGAVRLARQVPVDGAAGPDGAGPDGAGPDWERVAAAGPARVWQVRAQLRARLVAETRRRLRASWRQRGSSQAELTWIDDALDENVLTIGFARRVPSYKRLTLMLRDPVRLKALLLDPEHPVQIVIAGKAHPADDGGKRLIQQMIEFTDDPAVRHRIAFLPDYDMALGRALVQGCDVWLNNPLRPLEACGTSGMKSSLNGGLNLSIRDGWWEEFSDGGCGWDIPSADGMADENRRDDLESAALYDRLSQSVAPAFYDRDADGLPRRWLEMVRHTLHTLGPQLQAARMVRQYATELYASAARSTAALSGGPSPYAAARELAAWRHRVVKAWPGVRIEHVEAEAAEPRLGSRLAVRATIVLGDLTPADVAVELVRGRTGDDDEIIDPVCTPLQPEPPGPGAQGPAVRYAGAADLGRAGPFGYTIRVLPSHPLLASKAELGLVAMPEAPVGMINGDLR
ncbi:MAG TPA: alpha-glucan family phosphorylase [Streptosporangiaceae bacterium]